MATTSPDNIWTPDAGDDYALTTDLAAMADTVQDAITATRINLFGLDSERPANGSSGLTNGMTWYSTDTGATWRYSGSAWVIEFRPLSDYTTTVTGMNPAHITVSSKYERRGNLINGFVTITRITASSPTGTVTVTLPTTPADSSTTRNLGLGSVQLQNNGQTYDSNSRYSGSNSVTMNFPTLTGSAITNGTNVNATFPTSAAHGVGTTYYVRFEYESA